MASKHEIVCIVVWSFILAINIDSAFGDLLHVPSQAEVIRGDNITIPCITTFAPQYSVHWQHTPVGSNGAIDIFFTDALIRKFKDKYDVNKDAAKGEYNLTILSALANDAGTYTCIDKGGTGQQRRTELTVLDSRPTGKSNVSLDQLAICGTEADYIGLSCDINYAGDQSPNLEWRQIFENGTEISLSNELPPDVRHDSVSYHLAMRVDPSMEGSVLSCQSTLAKYSWTSEELRIQYALNSSLIVSLQEAEKVRCRAATNQPCSYKWTQAADSQNILSENEILDLANVPIGTYTCMAHCSIRSKPCFVFGQTVQFTGKEKSAPETNSTNFLLIVGIVAGILGLILSTVLGIFCFLRHPKKSKEETEEIAPLLSDENLTPTMDLEKLIVRGIAELNDSIYVIFQEKPIIRVISDLVKFVKEKDIPVIMMEDPWDLESCAKSQCLYVADRIPSCIWKVDPISEVKPEKWMVGLKKPHKFSVISGGRIAIPKWPSSIEILGPDGTPVKTIELPTDMLEPYYVLGTARETFVVAHGHQKSAKHRVCEIEKREGDDSDWVIQWSYPENGSDKINNIDILAMDNEGRIFVTDQNNLRIIVLSESGKKLNAIITKTLPYRLCYARKNELLLVGHYGAISVYKVKDVGGGELEIQHLREAVCVSFPFENPWTTSTHALNLGMHLDNDSVKRMEVGENTVRGIAQLYNKFYVIFQDESLIRVFDDSGEKLRDIPVQNLSDPWFIDACPKNKCLYITDKGRECIVKISDLDRKDGKVPVRIWKAKIGEPYKLSVISGGRVLIPIWPATLEIYDSESQLKDTIVLPDDMREPCHAVEADKGSYILGHGDKKSDTHRVCKIKYSNRKGCEVVWKYGNQRGNKIDQLNRPRNISIDEKGRVFITDEGNRRLVVLDENGNRLSEETTNLTPERLFYSKSIGRLLVGHYGSINQYVVDEEERLKCCPSAGCFTCANDV